MGATRCGGLIPIGTTFHQLPFAMFYSSNLRRRVILEEIMNTTTKSLVMFAAAAALACIPSHLVSAQDQDQGHDSSSSSSRHHFNVDFKGGTLGEFVSQLREQDPSFNIIVQEDASKFPLPEIELNSVTISSCMWILDNEMIDREGVRTSLWTEQYPSVNQNVIFIGSDSTVSPRPNRNSRRPQNETTAIDEVKTRVFSVGMLLDSGVVDAGMILGNISQLNDMQQAGASRIVARIDEKTGVLMVRSTPWHIETVIELLDSLRQSIIYIKSVRVEPKAAPALDPEAVELPQPSFHTREEFKQQSTQELRESLVEISQARKRFRGDSKTSGLLDEQFAWVMEELKSRQ